MNLNVNQRLRKEREERKNVEKVPAGPKEKAAKPTPPNQLEAERCVLGALLLDIQSSSTVFEVLVPEDFYLQQHQLIYSAITNLYDRMTNVDIVLTSDELKKEGALQKVGGEDYLMQLMEELPSAANAPYYAELVRDASIKRKLVEKGTRIVQEAYNGKGSAKEILDRAEQDIFDIAQFDITNDFVPIPNIIDPLFERWEKGVNASTAITTGFTKFDELTTGLYPAQLIVVAGRPSMGKTTFAMNIAQYVALELNKSVGVFSLEVTRDQVVQNLLAAYTRIDATSLRQGTLSSHTFQELIASADRVREAPIYIDDTPSISTLEVKAKARRLKAKFGLDILVVDYLQLMHNPGFEKRQEEISMISRGLKAIARDLNVPVITISQLSRAVESREGHRPRLSDLRESGAIEQDADLVVLLYREEYYKPDDEGAKGKAEAIIAKQRNGPTGTVPLAFIGNMLRFENLAYESDPQFG